MKQKYKYCKLCNKRIAQKKSYCNECADEIKLEIDIKKGLKNKELKKKLPQIKYFGFIDCLFKITTLQLVGIVFLLIYGVPGFLIRHKVGYLLLGTIMFVIGIQLQVPKGILGRLNDFLRDPKRFKDLEGLASLKLHLMVILVLFICGPLSILFGSDDFGGGLLVLAIIAGVQDYTYKEFYQKRMRRIHKKKEARPK